MKNEPTYMTVKVPCQAWDQTPQTYLGNIDWSSAVKIAKQQSNEVRLCIGPGYRNQGHYIQPERYYSNPEKMPL